MTSSTPNGTTMTSPISSSISQMLMTSPGSSSTVGSTPGQSSPTSETVYNLPFTTWLAMEIASSTLIAIALYINLVLVRYSCIKTICAPKRRAQIQNNNSKIEQNNNSSSIGHGGGQRAKGGSTSSAEGGKRKRSDGTGKAARPLRVLCLMAAFFALLRISSDQLELATYGGPRVDCKLYQVLVVVFYAISATLNYTALWVRLRIFFDHPVMKHLASMVVKCLIWFALAAIIGSSLLNTLIFTITVSAVDKEHGCSLGETTSISPTVRYVILTISSVGAQLLLLSLFLYPLMKHRASVKKSLHSASTKTASTSSWRSIENNNVRKPTASHVTGPPTNPDVRRVRGSARTESDSDTCGGNGTIAKGRSRKFVSFRKQKQANREKKLLRIMRRVMIMAIVCAISDIITAIITIAFNNHPRIASNLFFNLNLLVNIISVLFSFGDWQERLFPCCAKCLLRKTQQASAPTSGSRLANGQRSNGWNHGAEGGRVTPAEGYGFHMQQRQDSTESQMVATPSQAPDDDVFTFDRPSST